MAKIITIIVVSALVTACTNTADIKKLADNYVMNNVCPALPNAEVIEICRVGPADNPVEFLKGSIKKQMYINASEKSLLYKKELQIESRREASEERIANLERKLRVLKDGGEVTNTENPNETEQGDFRNSLILNAEHQSAINALKSADSKGFYVVYVAIKYGINDCEHFDIIVSKDMRVLNKPIDLSNIDDVL